MAASSTMKKQRYSQELSAYTLRQFYMASTLLDRKQTDAMPQNSAMYRSVCQADKIVHG
jgi:hypothetical protein